MFILSGILNMWHFNLLQKYEIDGDILRVTADNDQSNFLVIGAANKEEALTQYQRMLTGKQ